MGGERVTEGVAYDPFGNATLLASHLDGFPHGVLVEVVAANRATA